jgi:outer membrane cobalamin receptor
MFIRHLLLAAVLVSAFPVSALAQTSPVTGRVTDPQGGAVGGATVTVTAAGAAGAGTPQTATTAADGTYSVTLAPGTHILQVEAPGFQTWIQSVVLLDGPQTVDVILPVGGVTENVVVAAPRLEEELPQEIERSGTRMQTITSTQIDNGGYNDVSQVLQAMVPGLYLAPTSGAFGYVSASFQGSRTNEILWLVDGVRISNRLYNGTTPIDTLPAHMVERIEILEGGQALFYGTQAVGGVINVVTKAFTEDGSGRAQLGLDTNEGTHLSGFTRNSSSGNRFVLFGSRDEADGFAQFPVDEFSSSTTDRERSYEVVNVGGKYAYDFSDAARFSALYQHSDVRLDNLRPARSSASQVGGLAFAFNDREEHIFSAKFDYTAQQATQLFFKTYYHQWDSHWSEAHNALGTGALRTISDQEFWGFKDYGVNMLAKFAPNRGLEYFAGYDFQNYSGEDEVLLIGPNTERVHALFGQIRTTPDLTGKATLAFGARYNAPTNSQDATVWNLSGQYDVTGNVFARATVGTALRYPDAYELFAIDPTCCFGNPNLKPETSTNVNGSVGGRILTGATNITLEAIGFYREVSDLIVDVDDGSGETTITANRQDTVRVRGVSFVGSSAFTTALSGSLGYTYSRSQQKDELAGGYSGIAGIPSNQLQASVDVHPSLPFGATLTVNRVGEMFDTVAGFGEVASGDYFVADLAGRVFLDRRRRHRVNLRLENLLDEDYTVRHSRGFRDAPATAFLVHNLGTPRTFHVSYSFSY